MHRSAPLDVTEDDVWQHVYSKLKIVARLRVRSNPVVDADDLAQIGALQVLTILRRDGAARHARMYLIERADGQMLNAMRGEIRERSHAPVSVEDLEAAGIDLADGDDGITLRAGFSAALERAGAELTPREQVVIEALYEQGCKLREIGAMLGGVVVSTIGSLEDSALRKYRTAFERAGIEAADVIETKGKS